MLKSAFIMCPPRYFEYSRKVHKATNGYVPNAFHPHAETNRELAFSQWNALRDKILSLGGEVVEAEPVAGLLDQVYTADPMIGLITGNQSNWLWSRFNHSARQGEQRPFTNALERFYQNKSHEKHLFPSIHLLEGSGDSLYDPFRDVMWSGFKADTSDEQLSLKVPSLESSEGRSDKGGHAWLSQWLKIDVISLEVQSPFFHIDTSIAFLPSGHILCCKDGLTEEAFNIILEKAFINYGLDPSEYLIEVSRDDANKFACNVVCMDDTNIITPEISRDLKSKIESKGYNVHMVDVSEFIKGGGGPHCLTNRINQNRPRQLPNQLAYNAA